MEPRHEKKPQTAIARELYPDVYIKILYERDYKNLIWKYGLGNGDDTEPNDTVTGDSNPTHGIKTALHCKSDGG
jgi:hypothetical protein